MTMTSVNTIKDNNDSSATDVGSAAEFAAFRKEGQIFGFEQDPLFSISLLSP